MMMLDSRPMPLLAVQKTSRLPPILGWLMMLESVIDDVAVTSACMSGSKAAADRPISGHEATRGGHMRILRCVHDDTLATQI
jgi:hypothetical protein